MRKLISLSVLSLMFITNSYAAEDIVAKQPTAIEAKLKKLTSEREEGLKNLQTLIKQIENLRASLNAYDGAIAILNELKAEAEKQ